MASPVNDRGQITIDPKVRRQLGIEPGMIAHQRVVNGRLEITFLPAPHRRSLSGVLHRPDEDAEVLTASELEDAVMEAVAREQQTKE